MDEASLFATLRGGRVWAVAAVHGEAARLTALHQRIGEAISAGDRLVYTGNFLGRGAEVGATVDELLRFRRRLLAGGRLGVEDIVFLRGAQEEMWQKLLQLQFAPNATQVLRWLLDQGVGTTIAAYGGRVEDALAAAREGILPMTRWTNGLRQAMRGHDGHTTLMSVLRHAAFNQEQTLLFVSGGLDPSRPLSTQSDSFWWGSSGFAAMEQPYGGFQRVVRGYDRRGGGFAVGPVAATIDAGCGFGGPLTAVCFTPDGAVAATIEA